MDTSPQIMTNTAVEHLIVQIVSGEILPDIPQEYTVGIASQLLCMHVALRNGHIACYRRSFNLMYIHFLSTHGVSDEAIAQLFPRVDAPSDLGDVSHDEEEY